MLCFSVTNIYAQLEKLERSSSEERVISNFSKPALMDSTQLDSLINNTMNTYHIAGMAALITTKEDGIIWKRNYGYSNIILNQPVEDTTLFLVASISKTIVATAIMQFWEADSFDLDDNINDYLDDFQVHIPYHYNDTVTFRMLMTHTSSIRDNWNVLEALVVCSDSPVPLDTFLINYFTPGGTYYNTALNFVSATPGTVWEYSNVATCILAHLVEKFSGVPFDQYCREYIFNPLEMNKTSWFLEGLDTTTIATPYIWENGQYMTLCHQGWPAYPAGMLRTNEIELQHFLSAYMNWGRYNGITILDSSSVDLILTVQLGSPIPLFGKQGLIWFQWAELNDRWPWGHGGSWWGYKAGMFFKQEEDWGVIWFMNSYPDNSVLPYLSNLFCDYAQDITEVEEISNSISHFYLEQNYPNPFNPSTSIQYAISSRQFVSLKVYDILGNEIITLVNEELPAGEYKIEFNAGGTSRDLSLTSGVYFYQLKAGDFIETKKMLLLK